jgi:signal transduction histidine kinase/ActR/RegA family two-component response regulator
MTPPPDATRSALDAVHHLLVGPREATPTLDGFLGDLAASFGASAAGLASLPDGREHFRFPAGAEETPLPWEDDPSLLERPGPVPGVVAMPGRAGSLLATPLQHAEGVAWMLWLEGACRDGWSDGEAGALALAGHALSRWLDRDPAPRWAEQLSRAVRQQRLEIAADVTRRLAHDFGNLLTGILGFTELALAQQVPANTPLHSYLNEVYRAAQGGAQLTHQLRMFSRRQSSTSRSCPLPLVLAEQEARLFSAREAGVHLRLNVPTDLPAVALDTEHLAHVLAALLDNAREALMGPGAISLSARLTELTEAECRDLFGNARPGPHVEITIADTGIGLSPDAQRRLFSEPFFTTKPRRRGFGLAITYGILQAHRGGFRLHGGAEGGALARVLLPVAGGSFSAARPSERVRGERVLVVDDDRAVLQVVAGQLERAGFRIDGVASGEAALEKYCSESGDPYRLVLTDVVMPGMGGVDLVRRLLQRDPAVRVLFMSAHTSPDYTRQDFASHGFELLAKPFRPETLVRAVRAAIDRPDRPVREGKPTPSGPAPVPAGK